jgi:transmembrane 9 superfamily protein 2/4
VRARRKDTGQYTDALGGAAVGYKRDVMPVPVTINAVPRPIPPQPFYLNIWVSILVGGLLPFGAVFVEMFFILSSIWQHRFYYMFGFLALVFVILLVTCSEMTIVLCYLHLCAEDYRCFSQPFSIPSCCLCVHALFLMNFRTAHDAYLP